MYPYSWTSTRISFLRSLKRKFWEIMKFKKWLCGNDLPRVVMSSIKCRHGGKGTMRTMKATLLNHPWTLNKPRISPAGRVTGMTRDKGCDDIIYRHGGSFTTGTKWIPPKNVSSKVVLTFATFFEEPLLLYQRKAFSRSSGIHSELNRSRQP